MGSKSCRETLWIQDVTETFQGNLTVWQGREPAASVALRHECGLQRLGADNQEKALSGEETLTP